MKLTKDLLKKLIYEELQEASDDDWIRSLKKGGSARGYFGDPGFDPDASPEDIAMAKEAEKARYRAAKDAAEQMGFERRQKEAAAAAQEIIDKGPGATELNLQVQNRIKAAANVAAQGILYKVAASKRKLTDEKINQLLGERLVDYVVSVASDKLSQQEILLPAYLPVATLKDAVQKELGQSTIYPNAKHVLELFNKHPFLSHYLKMESASTRGTGHDPQTHDAPEDIADDELGDEVPLEPEVPPTIHENKKIIIKIKK